MRPRRLIRSAREIPKWFDIDKYRPLQNLDLVGWARQISIRSFVVWLLGPGREPGTNSVDETAKRWLQEIECNPVIKVADTSEHVNVWHSRRSARPYDTYSVWALESYFAYCHFLEFVSPEDPFMASVKAACESEDRGNQTEEAEALATMPYDLVYKRRGISTEGQTTVVVDLATDEQILDDFRHWLSGFRTAIEVQAPKSNFTEKDFASWCENGVIPYMDLTLWARAEGYSITQNALGEAIFPMEDRADTTERIRRTTKPKAERLLKEETARALEYQATASQIARKMSGTD